MPQPGIFPVPYGSGPTHTQGVITGARPSSVGPIGPGIPGSGKAARLGGGGNPLSTFPPSDRDLPMNGEMYGPVIGHGLNAHGGHGHGHGHGHHSQHGHSHHQAVAGPSSRHTAGSMDESLNRKEKKRKESSKLSKEMSDRRDDGRHFTESISALHNAAHILSTRPEMSAYFNLRLYPLSLERSALLAQLESEERYALDCAQVAYDEERDRVEEEWRKGRDRVRERLLEGIEERRKRAREEKDVDFGNGDVSLDPHSRPPVTRKLRNKLGTSPPPTPHNGPNSHLPGGVGGHVHPLANALGLVNINGLNPASLPITTGPFLNPHSLSVDDLPSPFPLPLTSTANAHASGTNSAAGAGGAGGAGAGAGAGNAGNGPRRRPKGQGGHPGQTLGGLGKSLLVLNTVKDADVDSDLGDIRRGNKRRRTAQVGAGK